MSRGVSVAPGGGQQRHVGPREPEEHGMRGAPGISALFQMALSFVGSSNAAHMQQTGLAYVASGAK